MPDYSNGKIYTIRCKKDDRLIYVGSTVQSLSQRLGEHRRHSKTQKISLYKYVEDWNDWYIELYELYPCKSKIELEKKEGEIIRAIGTINICIAGRKRNDYYSENAEKECERNKNYYYDNWTKIQSRHKQYYIANTDKVKEYSKQYSIQNKDKINQRRRQRRLEKKSQHIIEQ